MDLNVFYFINASTGKDCSLPCAEGRWGVDCAFNCSCSNEGICSSVTGQCRCPAGWTGKNCDDGKFVFQFFVCLLNQSVYHQLVDGMTLSLDSLSYSEVMAKFNIHRHICFLKLKFDDLLKPGILIRSYL